MPETQTRPDQFIGIFATGRNGSTLLTRLLDGADGVYAHPLDEGFLSFFNDLAGQGRVRRLTRHFATTRKLRHLDSLVPSGLVLKPYKHQLARFVREHLHVYAGSEAQLEDLLAAFEDRPYTAVEFMKTYLRICAEHALPSQRLHTYIFKTIEAAFAGDYAREVDGLGFIHMIRHPVATCSSMKRSFLEKKKVPGAYLGNDWLVTLIEKRWMPHVSYLLEQESAARHITVKYEDLVSRPEEIVSAIHTTFGLSGSPEMRGTLSVFGRPIRDDLSNPSKEGVSMPNRPVADLQQKENYSEILTARELDYIIYRTRHVCERLGYELSKPSSAVRVFFSWAVMDSWDFKHCHSVKWGWRSLVGAVLKRWYVLRALAGRR